MYCIYLFDIENKQEKYAECLQVIEFIQKQNEKCLPDADFLKSIKYAVCDYKKQFYKIDSYHDVKNYDDLLIAQDGDEIQYVFQVDCSDENDMVNLIYYCLLSDELEGKCIFCVKADNGYKLVANIKDLLSFVADSQITRECYCKEGGSYHRIYLNVERNTKRFSPIFRIDEQEESVAFWGQSMHSFLLKLYRENAIAGSQYVYSKNYFLPHIIPSHIRNKNDEVMWEDRGNSKEVRLLNIMLECFCTSEKRNLTLTKERYEIWKSEELYFLVKDIPLLAMYIFCVFDYFLKGTDVDPYTSIQEEIFNARDMADGVLQILENIYHSEKKRGFFCFRVHNDSVGRGRQYLLQHYGQYMNQENMSGKDVRDYLEVKVVDFSHSTIPQKFNDNFVKRMNSASAEDKNIYTNIQEEAKNISVKSFFEASAFWQDYNKISENVVHHYGLQVFDSFVSCYEGYFRVRSQEGYQIVSSDRSHSYSTIENDDQNFGILGLPGTQYDIILPFKRQKTLQNITLNVNINYTDHLQNKYEARKTIDFTTVSCRKVYDKVKSDFPHLSYQEKKEKTIHELERKLSEKLGETEQNTVLHFSAKKIATTMIEMFCKTIMLYIAKKPKEDPCYIMITDCTQSHFVEITRMLALFYDKQGTNTLMRGTQIFLSGEQPGEEFLISGCSLGEVIGSTEKLAFSRCVTPDCLKILKRMLKNRSKGPTPNEMVSIVPFDMIRYEDDKPTVFENNLRQVLETEVQSTKFGCRIDKLHVRIGSKIHIKKFYEAELLLHNNYYTSRFAYWLFGEICANKNINSQQQITLVGYENYSEMLLNELRDMLKKKGIYADYIIYEQKTAEKFRTAKSLIEYRNSQFILIVPINSTMTTHIKVAGFLKRSIREEINSTNGSESLVYELPKAFYYGIILVAPQKNFLNEYWKYKENDENGKKAKNIIVSKIDQSEMKYYMRVQTEWSHPLKCRDCFPLRDYTKESPLIETNKESVVPMQAIGVRRERRCGIEWNINSEDIDRIKELSQFLVYKHVERNGNHFNYYFCTEELWDYSNIRKNVGKWLENQNSLFPMMEQKTYDIIVAPLHYSNTAFVEEVNRHLFKNVALVLHFDADKEFRMNVKAKYSSIQQLYDNLCEGDEESIINYHYIDDTIVSGRTFHRTKSIIGSLITPKQGAKVTINLFKSVVLLLNRLSPSSIREYIGDAAYFMAYFNLNISSMRVNADACVLCKKYGQWTDMAKQASLNEVYLHWKNKSKPLKCVPVEKVNQSKMPINKQKRAEQYMIASHKAKSLLEQICSSYSNEEIANVIVDNLFPDTVENSLDELIAVLKVLGRPFLTFRREIKESVFQLMLTMFDQLLASSRPAGDSKLQKMLGVLWESPNYRTVLIIILINRLTELESGYIIRKRIMKRLLDYASRNFGKGKGKERREFIDNYLHRVKQLVGQSNDFAKGLFLEYLLLYNKEYNNKDAFNVQAMETFEGKNEEITFKRKVYLENTKLINYGIEALAWNFESDSLLENEELRKELKDNYYLDNFVQYLLFHQMVEVDEQGEIVDFTSEDNAQKLAAMIRLQMLYQEVFSDSEETGENSADKGRGHNSDENLKNIFHRMLQNLKTACGALDAEIIVPYRGSIENVNKYIALEFRQGTDVKNLCIDEERLFEFMENNTGYEGNTYTIKEWGDRCWVIVKFCGDAQEGDNIPMIFLVFPYEMNRKDQLIHLLKNILVFREKIWRLLNLSSSTLLQNWTDNLYYKQQMLKDKATSHDVFLSMHKKLENVSKMICDPEVKNELFLEHFNLIVNSLIGYMNAQVLGGKGRDFFAGRSAKLGDLAGDWEIYCAMKRMWDLDISVEEEVYNKQIRKGTEIVKKIPELGAMRVLFLAVFQNVIKHGKRNENKKFIVEIYGEGDKLCIANEVSADEKDRACESIRPEGYRRRDGISQAVIFDLCQGWYSDSIYEEIFKIEPIDDSNGWKYVVKLPIIEREGAK